MMTCDDPFFTHMNWIIPMKTIYCRGSHDLETKPEPEALAATVSHIFNNKQLLRSLSGKEQTAIELSVIGVKAEPTRVHKENCARILRLHNQYGHLPQ